MNYQHSQNKNTDEFTRQFTLESFTRGLNNSNDIDELKDLCKSVLSVYLKEKDHSEYLLKSLKELNFTTNYVSFVFGITFGVGIATILYLIFGGNL